ncbi:EAL domain-containing protein [Caminibacter sp.]
MKEFNLEKVNKNIHRLVYIPMFFIIGGIIAFLFLFYFYIKRVTYNEFQKTFIETKQEYKKYLKINLDSIVEGVNEIRIVSYSSTENFMRNILDIFYKNYKNAKNKEKFLKKHYTSKLFFYVISRQIVYPSIYQTYIKLRRKHLITFYENKKYLSIEKKFGNITLGVAFDLKTLNTIIKKEIIGYISSLSHGKNYIAVSKITNWFPKNGNFGIIIYHPLKKYQGFVLNINKPDVKGNYFRKKYFNCLKEKDGCFEEYYFKNPESGQIEKKLSYFRIYRPYDYVFVKGIYYSDILSKFNSLKNQIEKRFLTIFYNAFFFLMVFVAFSIIFARKIVNKIIEIIKHECSELKREYEKSNEELIKRIYYDKLTGLPTRVKLEMDLEKFKSILLLDVKEFSNINNLYGFDFGNEVLKCISRELQGRFDNVYRVGSDEFAVLLSEEVDEEYLKKISSEVYDCFGVEISFIIGASNIQNLFVTGESALKTAIHSNMKYYIYKSFMKEKQKEKFNLLKKLRIALKNKDVIPFYQAIVDKDGKIHKFEALMRIEVDNEILTPFKIMNLIKDAKLYDEFSKIMIKKVFNDVYRAKFEVSINFSFSDINNPDIRKLIMLLLEKYNIGEYITFEILESESIENIDVVKSFINEVRKYSVKIAIDDFGSGYSNFVNILSLDPDYIKIDGSLVKNIEKEEYYEIIKLLKLFADKFYIITIAEFVENKKLFEILKTIGIDCYQGYYFYKPLPFDKIALKKGNNENSDKTC